MKNLRGNICLTLAALIWGSAFVPQSLGMDYVGPYTFLTARSVLGAIFLFLIIVIFDRKRESRQQRLRLLKAGVCCGSLLFVASILQQIGMVTTTVGKAGFLTALYIVIVPVAGIFFRKKPTINVWVGVILAAVGLYLLCMKGSLHLAPGDLLVFLSAFAFASQIMVIDHFSDVDGIKLSFVQFTVVAILSGIFTPFMETVRMDDVWKAFGAIAYCGIMSSGIAYTFQILGQQWTDDPVIASLLMSLESVFSLIAGIIVLHQVPTPREFLGAALMFSAIIIVQIPVKYFKMIRKA
ncbi:MAG: DMT family transporter [Lachnospiraceae bacterium]|jgi:drug/metabolite transporter (DMT)-like permease|nr:DMT family transporter [Lachnospiraceae bacterium]MEE3460787.1 DMT family transporter [Lachnospiraceae bacterium]